MEITNLCPIILQNFLNKNLFRVFKIAVFFETNKKGPRHISTASWTEINFSTFVSKY